MSERDPSVHYIQTPAPTLASFALALRWAALLAVVVSFSMTVLTTDSSPRASQFLPSVVRACSLSSFTPLHNSVPEEGFWCRSLNLLLHTFASLAANRCCLQSKIVCTGESPESLIIAHCGVVGSAPRMDLASQLRRSWRLSRWPTSLGSHQSSLAYCATAWTHGTWTALALSGTAPYILVTVHSVASAALAVLMYWL